MSDTFFQQTCEFVLVKMTIMIKTIIVCLIVEPDPRGACINL